MKREIEEVSTGEVKTASAGTTLVASALGSCIAVVVYDPQKGTGGIAHLMLPGTAKDRSSCERFRYAEDGIEELLRQMTGRGSDMSDLCVVVAGGANVLNRKDDTICRMNIGSALEVLQRSNLTISANSLGGVQRRRVRLNIRRGCVLCTIGNGPETLMWTWEKL